MQLRALYSAQTTVFPRKWLFILWKVLYAAVEVVFITQGRRFDHATATKILN
jgi:hypothetical protein